MAKWTGKKYTLYCIEKIWKTGMPGRQVWLADDDTLIMLKVLLVKLQLFHLLENILQNIFFAAHFGALLENLTDD